MTVEGKKTYFSSDRPLSDPSQDKLGYASFAQQLAQAIQGLEAPEGIVIAISGPWGSGKTTVLNFVVHYLEALDKRERPVILRFTPWWFSGREDIVRLFFAELQRALSGSRFPERARKIAPKFFRLISPVLKAGVPYGEPISAGLDALINIAQQTDDIYELKQKLADALRKSKRRLIVVVDDVDRLTAEEIRHFFQAVKAVADLPNIIYLIAYDQQVVAQCLKDVQGVSGEEYLEKIVQVPLTLPQFDKSTLRKIFAEALESIFHGLPEELFDQSHWQRIYFEGVDYFLKTPRDVFRLLNALSFNYALVINEVNPADMVAIETLRLFMPSVYMIIRENELMFAGSQVLNEDIFRKFHRKWLGDLPEEQREMLRKLLTLLFPKLQYIEKEHIFAADFESVWRKAHRVCSSEIFPRYFRLSIPEEEISLAEMKIYLGFACDEQLLKELLLQQARQKRPDGTTRVRHFLDRLLDYADKEIQNECISPILRVFFDIGDELLCPDDRVGVFDVGNETRMGRVVYRLLRRLQPEERYEILHSAISAGRAIAVIVDQIMMLGAEHGKYGNQAVPEREQLINKEQFEELEKLALQKVRQAADEGRLAETPELPYTLYRWLDWEADAAKQWVQGLVETDEGLLRILVGFLRKTHRLSVTAGIERVRYRLRPDWLNPFVDVQQLADRVRHLAGCTDLSNTQKIAVYRFLREYELLQQGRDPDTFDED